MLSMSVIPFYRYVLPVVVLASLFAALALLEMSTFVRSVRQRQALLAIATLGLIASNYPNV